LAVQVWIFLDLGTPGIVTDILLAAASLLETAGLSVLTAFLARGILSLWDYWGFHDL
jgi:hypothetical protein